MTRHGLTRSQWDALAYIRVYIAEHGRSPSFEEIQIKLGYASKSGVYRVVHALIERGHLSGLPGRARSIALTGAGLFQADHYLRSLNRETARVA